jgi:hypothetical protein
MAGRNVPVRRQRQHQFLVGRLIPQIYCVTDRNSDVTNMDELQMTYEAICKSMPEVAGVAQGASKK